MKTVYAVPYIEIEFGWGSRPFGYKVYKDRELCMKETKEKSAQAGKEAQEGSDYYGPERPSMYYEIPADCLPEEGKKHLKKNASWHSPDNWRPKFTDKGTSF